ncbi:MAG: hypothetical protein D6707_04170 [Bacteroidetes bacterium]|nr:MAG: hypothetical protein D6707_04170 [Bacteroidota bacterium]
MRRIKLKKAFLLLSLLLFSCATNVDLNRVRGIRGKYYPHIENNDVIFSIYAPDATIVSIAGNFNGWNPQVNEMKKNDNGVWSIALPFKPGKAYYYKFVVDGYWVADPDNPNTVPDGFGGKNSVFKMEERK